MHRRKTRKDGQDDHYVWVVWLRVILMTNGSFYFIIFYNEQVLLMKKKYLALKLVSPTPQRKPWSWIFYHSLACLFTFIPKQYFI